MFDALTTLATKQEKVLSPYLYRKLMGHDVEEKLLKVQMPKKFSVHGLPSLNYSQKKAIKAALERPLALIQVRLRDARSLSTQSYSSTFISGSTGNGEDGDCVLVDLPCLQGVPAAGSRVCPVQYRRRSAGREALSHWIECAPILCQGTRGYFKLGLPSYPPRAAQVREVWGTAQAIPVEGGLFLWCRLTVWQLIRGLIGEGGRSEPQR